MELDVILGSQYDFGIHFNAVGIIGPQFKPIQIIIMNIINHLYSITLLKKITKLKSIQAAYWFLRQTTR